MANTYYDTLLLLLIISAQVLYAMIKKTLSVSSPYLIQSKYLTKMEFGMISTKFSLSYGVSKLIGGVLSDFVSPKSLYVTGLMLGSAVNLIIAVAAPMASSERRSYSLFSIDNLWSLNGMAQGIGGPALNKLLVVSFDSASRGSMLSIFTFASNVGYLISPLALLPLSVIHWQLPFLVCGSLGLAISILIQTLFAWDSNRSRNPSLPSSASASPCTNEGGAIAQHVSSPNDVIESPKIAEPPPPRSSTWSQLLLMDNATWFQIAMLLAAHVLTYFTLKGMHEWTGLYLIERRHVTIGQSVELMLWNEVGGIAGSFICGIASDLLGKRLGRHSRRSSWIICAASALLCCISVVFLSGSGGSGPDPHSNPTLMMEMFKLRLWLFLSGFGINGPKTLLPFALMDLFPSSLAGSLSGIMGFLAQCGASYAGGGIGHMLTVAKTRSGSEGLGWDEVMATIAATSLVIGLCILLPIAVLPENAKPKAE